MGRSSRWEIAAVHEQLPLDGVVPAGTELDSRWMYCHRPYLAVGGELVTGMLDLQRDDRPAPTWRRCR